MVKHSNIESISALESQNGHFFCNEGSLVVTSSANGGAFARPTDVATTHLNFANKGQGYIESHLEVDGTAYFDGDIDHNGTNLGFYSVAPVARPAAYTQTYATASRTHANPTASTLTDSTGGFANQTVAAVSGSGDDGTINSNFADVVDESNKLIADVANVKQVLNSSIDDDQIQGLKQ